MEVAIIFVREHCGVAFPADINARQSAGTGCLATARVGLSRVAAGTGSGGGMNKRASVSRFRRLAMFRDKDGRCHVCGEIIEFGTGWELEHIIPLAMGGADDETNWAPAHVKCHKIKTSLDLEDLGRAKRREAKHLGAKRSRNPIRGWRKFNGDRSEEPEGVMTPTQTAERDA